MSKRSKTQRQELKRLKKAGLYSGDLRKRITKYAKSLITKFSDFLTGRSKVVRLKTKSNAKSLADQFGFESKGKRVVIPARQVSGIEPKIEIKKRGNKYRVKTRYGRGRAQYIITSTNHRRPSTLSSLPKLEPQQRYVLVGRYGGTQSYTYEQLDELLKSYDREKREHFEGILHLFDIQDYEGG